MQSSQIKTLPRNVFNSIKQILKQISESSVVIPSKESIWNYLISKSEKKEISPTIKDIRDYFIRENNITDIQFNFFESFFREFGQIEEKSAEVTRTILGKVASRNSCFELIISEKDYYIPIINNAKEDASDFKENVLSRLENDSENSDLMDFASKIGVEYRKDENAEK